MTTIDRTAFPRPGERLTLEELQVRYALTDADRAFIESSAVSPTGRLAMAVMLKTRQGLGYFPALADVPEATIAHLADQLGPSPASMSMGDVSKSTLYRYRTVIRTHLAVMPFDDAGERLVAEVVLRAAETMSDPADLINRAAEALHDAAIDLPAFSTLDRLISHLRTKVHQEIYASVAERLTQAEASVLDALLVVPPDAVTTPFNRLKQVPGPARLATIKLWTDRLDWLGNLANADAALSGVAPTKLRQFAAEATALEVSELLDMALRGKRHTLLLSLLHHARTRCRDELIGMFLRRIRRTQAAAKEKLDALRDQHRELEESLIGVLGQVLDTAKDEEGDTVLGQRIRGLLIQKGGVDTLTQQVEAVSAWHGNNDLPLLWPIHAKHRSLLFRLFDLMDIRSATQDRRLLDVFARVSDYRYARRDDLPAALDLDFASQRWQAFVIRRREGRSVVDRRALEVCVFIHLADALQSGDFYVVGSEQFADYRAQLLPWVECQPRLAAYCETLAMPQTGGKFVTLLKSQLTEAAAAVDANFPANATLSLDPDGTPHLKQLRPKEPVDGLPEFKREIRARMPERHLLDILKYAEHWTGYTRHFGPPSGADTKLAQAVRRYVFTVFGYGCNLGPGQTARHAPELVTQQALRRINAQHINAHKLEAAMTDLIDEYARFALPRHWGSGQAAIADGTHVKLRENNLIGSRHVRYGGYGGIAYHHIADTYIALFTTFIPCGVWEAVHILDGLLKNCSQLQPDTLHADTQGQSEPVFGLCRLLGITLMPRMRTWDDVAFYRPSGSVRYRHIDALFTREIDWLLIETHWQDMMQVVLSIQAGLVTPSMLLRKLGSRNRKNRLYQAFRELGRVERTLFLLRFISDPQTRRTIRAETTKIESYNDFLDWISFGGAVVKSADPVEQEKQIKYASLVANAIMLSNVADLTTVLTEMADDDHPVTPELVAAISPYTREHIRRFGRYVLDMDDIPEPLNPDRMPFKNAA